MTINNKPIETTATTLAELMVELSMPSNGVAVAINNKMISREKWADTILEPEMNLIIIKAVCGG